MDVFTRAGLQRIAVACGATIGDVVTGGDPAGALARRWAADPLEDWFTDGVRARWDSVGGNLTLYQCAFAAAVDQHGWLGLETVGPLPFVRFAGLIEAGIRFGYIDLTDFPGREDLRQALDRLELGDLPAGKEAGLAIALRQRLDAGGPLSGPGDAASIAAFESYLRLDEAVRQDEDLRAFLKVSHGAAAERRLDAVILATPEDFAAALVQRQVRGIPVGGQAVGGIAVLNALQRLTELLAQLQHRSGLSETLLLHARWAHQVDEVLARLQAWVWRAQNWYVGTDAAVVSDAEWRTILRRMDSQLVKMQRERFLLSSMKYDITSVLNDAEPEAKLANAPAAIGRALDDGLAGRARMLATEAAGLCLARLDLTSDEDVLGYWQSIAEIADLGGQGAAATLSASVYPALRRALERSKDPNDLLRLEALAARVRRAGGSAKNAATATGLPTLAEDTKETYPEESSTTDVAKDETHRLIASNKIEGTAVYNRQGERLGSVYEFMIDKHTGKVEYAVMSFGGFLGIGESYHPVPWKSLNYDTSMGGFVVDLDQSKLEGAPSYQAHEDPWVDREYSRSVYDYFGESYPYDN